MLPPYRGIDITGIPRASKKLGKLFFAYAVWCKLFRRPFGCLTYMNMVHCERPSLVDLERDGDNLIHFSVSAYKVHRVKLYWKMQSGLEK